MSAADQIVALISEITGGQLGVFDAACPACGPERRSPVNRQRKTLRIWAESSFTSWHCARCGSTGSRRGDQEHYRLDAAETAKIAERNRIEAADRLRVATWLWERRQPIGGTVAEAYLRDARGYRGPIPGTLGFLPADAKHAPSLIAAFGMPSECPATRRLHVAADGLRGVHLTALRDDGSWRLDGGKRMVGHSATWPIVLSPTNDSCGLAISEGIEDSLSIYVATGLPAWAAGSASRLPAVAERVPRYVECVTIVVDEDQAGQRHAAELAQQLTLRGIEANAVTFGAERNGEAA